MTPSKIKASIAFLVAFAEARASATSSSVVFGPHRA
jgi:hypothetical protein